MDRQSASSRLSYASSSYSEVNYASSLVKESAVARQYLNADDLYLKARMLVAPLLATARSSSQNEVKWTELEKLGDHTMLSWGRLESEKKDRTIVRAVARVPAKLDEVMYMLMCDSTARLTTALSIIDPTIEQGEVLFTAYPTEHQYDHPNYPLCNVKRTWNALKKANKRTEKAKMKEMVFLDYCTIEGDQQSGDRVGVRAFQSLDIPENALPTSSTSTPPQSRVQWLERSGFVVKPMQKGWSEITFIGRIKPGSAGGRGLKIGGDHKRDLVMSYLRQFANVVEGISQEIAYSIRKSGSVSKDKGFSNDIRCMLNPGYIDEAQTMSSKANKLLGRPPGAGSPTLFNPDAVDQEWLQTIPANNNNNNNDSSPGLNLKATRFETLHLDGVADLLDSVGKKGRPSLQQTGIHTTRSLQSISSTSSMSSDAIAAALAATDSVSHVSSSLGVRRSHTQPTSRDTIIETTDVRELGVPLRRTSPSGQSETERESEAGSCSGFTRASEATVNDLKLEQLERQLEAAKRKAEEAEERSIAQAKQMERLESKLDQLTSANSNKQLVSNEIDDMSDIEAFLNASFAAASSGASASGNTSTQSVGDVDSSNDNRSIAHAKSVDGVDSISVTTDSEKGVSTRLSRQTSSRLTTINGSESGGGDADAMAEVEAFLKQKYQEAVDGGSATGFSSRSLKL